MIKKAEIGQIKDYMGSAENEFFSIARAFWKRDFRGNKGLVIKNSAYQFSTTFVSKIGGLLFTIILARILLPELFGLYSLALSTIVLFSLIADLGANQALVYSVSKSLGKNDEKRAKKYFDYLVRLKFLLILITGVILFASAYFIAEYYYNKPITYALFAGSFYILFRSGLGFFESFFNANNKFKEPLYKETIFQVLRLAIVPLAAYLSINVVLHSSSFVVFSVIAALSTCHFISLLVLFGLAKKKIPYMSLEAEKLTSKEKSETLKLTLGFTGMTITTLLFGFIDIILLGRFVSEESIGFYQAAFSLVGSIAPLLAFSAVLFPVFNRIEGARLKRGFSQSRLIVVLLSLAGSIAVYFSASIIVNLVFGSAYGEATRIVEIFSILIFLLPMISLYSNYIISREKIKSVVRVTFLSIAVTILLLISAIYFALPQGDLVVIAYSAWAIVLSRGLHLLLLVALKRKVEIEQVL